MVAEESPYRVRLIDLLIGSTIGAVYAVIWSTSEVKWNAAGNGWGWIGLFAITSILSAPLISKIVFGFGGRVRFHPAEWLGAQVVFWNPLAWHGVGALCEYLAPETLGSLVVSGFMLVLAGVPTSIFALMTSPDRWWGGLCLLRILQAIVGWFLPVIPSLVMVLACLVVWGRIAVKRRRGHDAQPLTFWQAYSFKLLLAEQIAAIVWFVCFFHPQ